MPTPSLTRFFTALIRALFHDMRQGDIALRAMGLVYTTLLSLAPLLALSFSVLKGFGVHNQIEPLLRQLFTPLGEKAEELTHQLLGFVDNVQVGVLGFAGLAVLLYTVISLMQKIEDAFNYMWEVRRMRTLWMQFRDYMSVILVGPILVFTALGIWGSMTRSQFTHSLSEIELLDFLITGLMNISPWLLILVAFTFLYLFIPNTRVKLLAAFLGASFAAICWQIAGVMFASFVVQSGQQTAIYSVFASLFLFMLWLYVAWIILLTGARLAYYLQYPDAVYRPREPIESSLQTRELIAAVILREIGQRFMHNQPPPTLDELRSAVPISRFLLMNGLEELIQYGLLSRDDNEPCHYLLRSSPEHWTIAHIRQLLWQGSEAQRQQASDVQRSIGITDDQWQELMTHPQHTVQSILLNLPQSTPIAVHTEVPPSLTEKSE